MLNRDKKGQVTVFIIVGILIVIIVGGVIFFASEDKFSKRTLSNIQVEPIRVFVDDCIENKVDELLGDLRSYGGYPGPGVGAVGEVLDEEKQLVQEGSIRVLDNININPKTDIELSLRNYLEDQENGCTVKKTFDNFNLNIDEVNIEILMQDQSIVVDVDWPITVSKGIGSILLSDFSYIVEDDLKYVNEVVVLRILNEENLDELSVEEFIEWKNTFPFLGNVFESVGGEIVGIERIFVDGHMQYIVNTKFGREKELNDFIFAVER